MEINIEKASAKAKCRGIKCKKLPEYINRNGRIKKGTSCAAITMDSSGGWHTSYYCRDCIDVIHLNMKAQLNPSLWIFK